MFSCNLPPAFLAVTWIFFLTCYCSNIGVKQIPKIRVSTESWSCRRKFSCHSLNLRLFNHESVALPLSYPRSNNTDLPGQGLEPKQALNNPGRSFMYLLQIVKIHCLLERTEHLHKWITYKIACNACCMHVMSTLSMLGRMYPWHLHHLYESSIIFCKVLSKSSCEKGCLINVSYCHYNYY